jgi:Predicted integral membrane protein
MEAHRIATLIIIAASLLTAVLIYPAAPEQIPTHWNIGGEPDAWSDTAFGLAIIPAILIATALILGAMLRYIGSGDTKTRRATGWFIVLLLALLFGIQIFQSLTILGYPVDPAFFFPILFALLYLGISILLPRIMKRNKMMGIRTPWTMRSDEVWVRTHQRSANVFRIAAGLTLFGVFYPDSIFLFVLAPAIIALLWCVLVSYLEYKNLREMP